MLLSLLDEPKGEEKREEPVPEIGEESKEVKWESSWFLEEVLMVESWC